jgi:hypothetical protein
LQQEPPTNNAIEVSPYIAQEETPTFILDWAQQTILRTTTINTSTSNQDI